MKLRFACAVVLALVCGAVPVFAGEKPFQLALFDPAQVIKNDQAISGLRLDLIYGKNSKMTGLDVGIVNHTTGDQMGFAYGGFNYVQGGFTGWQDGIVNIADTKFLGLQSGLVNQSKDGHGLQWGFVNITERMSGVQVGVVNYTQVMDKGLQIGVGNFIMKDGIPFLPIVNWRF